MISAKFRNYTNKITHQIAKIFVALNISPNAATMLTILFALITSYFILQGNYLLAGIFILITGGVDALDGAIARITNKTTKFGGYLDAIVDRYVEFFFILAIGIQSGLWVPIMLFLFGSMMTSYSKARTAIEVKISNTNWPEFIERGERLTILAIGLIIFGFWKELIFGNNLLFWLLWILAVLTNFSALQRIIRAKKIIEEAKE
ncbi:MAG: CDP-alcohol phosphatidyltransferase family protein [archaeon]|nr:CDP-alcohol phosphatidyltransferase family protein [archaeon]